MKKVRLPKQLKRGDTIGIIAPSESLTKISNENISIGVHNLSKLGFNVIFSSHVSFPTGLSDSAKVRATDFMDMMTCKKIDAVMAAIGGYSSLELLEHLDTEILVKSNKPFIGFSDITILNQYLLSEVGLMNFYGPTFAMFCQRKIPRFTVKSFISAVCSDENQYVGSSVVYADDLWYLNNNGIRSWKPNNGWNILHHALPFDGTISGGNLETLLALAGTKYMPNFKNCVLFLEEGNAKSCEAVRRELRQLKLMGIFTQIKALVFGRFWGWSQDFQKDFFNSLTDTVLKDLDIPVLYNLDFGHSDPMLTIPFGGNAFFDGRHLHLIKRRQYNE